MLLQFGIMTHHPPARSHRTDTVALIADWLESERLRALDVVAASGRAPSYSATRWVGKTDGPSQSSYEEQLVEVSAANNHESLRDIERASYGQRRTAEEIAARLVAEFGADSVPWGVHRVFARTTPETTVARLLSFARTKYLRDLRTLAADDPPARLEAAAGLVAMLDAEELRSVTTIAVGGIDTAGRHLEHSGVSVRELTSIELGLLAEEASRGSVSLPAMVPIATRLDSIYSEERHVLRVESAQPKHIQPRPGDRFARVLLALQLLGYCPHGSGLTRTWLEPGPDAYASVGRVSLRLFGDTMSLGEEDLRRVVALAERISAGSVARPTSRAEVSLHSFSRSANANNDSDSLIHAVIALESLLLFGIRGELKFRFALYGALLLGRGVPSRRAIHHALGEVYDMRSRVVHGAARPKPVDLQRCAHTARELASRLLVKAVLCGWPEPSTLERLALGDADAYPGHEHCLL